MLQALLQAADEMHRRVPWSEGGQPSIKPPSRRPDEDRQATQSEAVDDPFDG